MSKLYRMSKSNLKLNESEQATSTLMSIVGMGQLCLSASECITNSIFCCLCAHWCNLMSHGQLLFTGKTALTNFLSMAIGVIQTYSFLIDPFANIVSRIIAFLSAFVSNLIQNLPSTTMIFPVSTMCTRFIIRSTPPIEKMLNLFIRANETIAFRVSENETVEQLKRNVGLKLGVDFRNIRLTYGAKDLVDNSHLSSYFLPDQGTLHLSSRLCGGCDTKRRKIDHETEMFEKKGVEVINLLDTDTESDTDSFLFSRNRNQKTASFKKKDVEVINLLDTDSDCEEAIDEPVLCESDGCRRINHFIHFSLFIFPR